MSNTEALPPLPEPYHGFYAAPMFSADQMRAYALAERERCIAAVMYELDSNGQAQAIEAEIRGVDWQNARSKAAEDRLAKLRLQGRAAGNMWAALDGDE